MPWFSRINYYFCLIDRGLYVCACVHMQCVFTETVLRAKSLGRVQLSAILWTVACQGPLSMRFSRQEYWSGLPRPSLGDLPDPGIEPTSLMSPALASGFLTTSTTRCIHGFFYCFSLLWTTWVPLMAFCFPLFFVNLSFASMLSLWLFLCLDHGEYCFWSKMTFHKSQQSKSRFWVPFGLS